MILLDPDIDAGPARQALTRAAHAKARTPTTIERTPWQERIPTLRTLDRFLADAQKAVRLKGEVSVLLTGDKAIRRMNRGFRGKDKATDVLSFPALAEGFGTAAERIAGDLAVSVDTARKQAREQQHALTCELKVLLLHGLLHLAGYDHEADEGQMARRERTLREKLRLPVGLIERAGVEVAPKHKTREKSMEPQARRKNKDAPNMGHPKAVRAAGEKKPASLRTDSKTSGVERPAAKKAASKTSAKKIPAGKSAVKKPARGAKGTR